MKKSIHTEQAPQAIGPYSQGIQCGKTIYFSGQIALNPLTMTMVTDDVATETRQVFNNLEAVCQAAGGELDAIVKLTIYLTDLSNFTIVNEIMQQVFKQPYPARTTIQVTALPKAARVEVDAIMVLES